MQALEPGCSRMVHLSSAPIPPDGEREVRITIETIVLMVIHISPSKTSQLTFLLKSIVIHFMAKKKAKGSTTPERTGVFYGVRCTDDDAALFERAAQIEGSDTAQRWMVQVCRKRARAILQAAAKGEQISVTEIVVVPTDGK